MEDINKLKLLYGNDFKNFSNGAYIIKRDDSLLIKTLAKDVIIHGECRIDRIGETKSNIIVNYRTGNDMLQTIINIKTGKSIIRDLRKGGCTVYEDYILFITSTDFKSILEILDNDFNKKCIIYNKAYDILRILKSEEQRLDNQILFNMSLMMGDVTDNNFISSIEVELNFNVWAPYIRSDTEEWNIV